MSNSKVNSLGLTQEEMASSYPDTAVELKEKHTHWIVNKRCLICGAKETFEDTVSFEVPRMIHRNCKTCNDKLPAHRYLNCTKCVPVLEDDVGDFIYSALE